MQTLLSMTKDDDKKKPSRMEGQTNVTRDQNCTAANQNQRNGLLLHYDMY